MSTKTCDLAIDEGAEFIDNCPDFEKNLVGLFAEKCGECVRKEECNKSEPGRRESRRWKE